MKEKFLSISTKLYTEAQRDKKYSFAKICQTFERLSAHPVCLDVLWQWRAHIAFTGGVKDFILAVNLVVNSIENLFWNIPPDISWRVANLSSMSFTKGQWRKLFNSPSLISPVLKWDQKSFPKVASVLFLAIFDLRKTMHQSSMTPVSTTSLFPAILN